LRMSYAEQLHRKLSPETADQRRERYKRPSPVTSADFDQNYEPINDSYPGNAAGSYTVRQDGETLRAIAQALWGDSSLWYLIAEANGLLGDGAQQAGRVLVIPNKVTNIHNNSQTWRPYNPGEAIGNVDPNWSAANMAGLARLIDQIHMSISTAMSNLATGNAAMAYTEQMLASANSFSMSMYQQSAALALRNQAAEAVPQPTGDPVKDRELLQKLAKDPAYKNAVRSAIQDIKGASPYALTGARFGASGSSNGAGLNVSLGGISIEGLDWRGVGASAMASSGEWQSASGTVENDIDRNLPWLELGAEAPFTGGDDLVPAGPANKLGVRFKEGGWQRSDLTGYGGPVMWRDKPGGKGWDEIRIEQLPRVVITGKSEATRVLEAWAQQSEPVWSFREASEAQTARAMAAYQARIDSGPQMSAITPEMMAVARAEEAQKEGLLNFLKAQGEMSIGGPVSAGVYLATKDVVAASNAADAMAPIEGFWAPRGGTTAQILASTLRRGGGLGRPTSDDAIRSYLDHRFGRIGDMHADINGRGERDIQIERDRLVREGHALGRHGSRVTPAAIDDRALHKKDPITGTTTDYYTGGAHGAARDASKFVTDPAMLVAETHIRNTTLFQRKIRNANQLSQNIVVIEAADGVLLESALGSGYKSYLFGKTRIGPVGTGSLAPIDFTDGTLTAIFLRGRNGYWKLHTLYPNKK
jgi:hypothetical protein